jgi:hypothetical protein
MENVLNALAILTGETPGSLEYFLSERHASNEALLYRTLSLVYNIIVRTKYYKIGGELIENNRIKEGG